MKIKKYRNKKWSQNFHNPSKSQILITASFFLSELTVSKINALLIFLQSLLAPYQLILLHKKSTFTILLWLASHFNEKLEQIRTHIPYFYFSISVLWSSPVEQLIKSEVLMMTTYHLLHLWQDLIQFLCQTKKNSIDRMIKIKDMVTKFS